MAIFSIATPYNGLADTSAGTASAWAPSSATTLDCFPLALGMGVTIRDTTCTVNEGFDLADESRSLVAPTEALWLCARPQFQPGKSASARMKLEHRYIVVEGPIGVGKSSLTNIVAQRFEARRVMEVVEENPFLASFYTDRAKYAFQTQMFFLLSRFKQQQELFQQDLFASVTVSDYLFDKDRIFAALTLDKNELGLYERVFDALGPRVTKPDLVIYLQARMDVLLARIKKRAREFERKFDPDYLEALCRSYNDFFFHYSDTPLLVVNTSDIDFVNNPDDLENLLQVIRQTKKGTVHYQPLPSRK
jgi:deoxyadenosine/deoxycytidine kinase